MPRPIESPQFWEQRIKEAAEGRDSRCIFYQATPYVWDEIDKAHKKIIQENVNGKVLDAGCGLGRISEWINGEYIGVDLMPFFIEKARILYPEREFLVADLRKLPFKDKEFDWAICLSIKGMMIRDLGKEEWQKMETELKRVSKKILILDYNNPEQCEIL